jgi:hypothetical protein
MICPLYLERQIFGDRSISLGYSMNIPQLMDVNPEELAFISLAELRGARAVTSTLRVQATMSRTWAAQPAEPAASDNGTGFVHVIGPRLVLKAVRRRLALQSKWRDGVGAR